MSNIPLGDCSKFRDEKKYKLIEDGIYLDLNDEDEARYRMVISYQLASDESNG